VLFERTKTTYRVLNFILIFAYSVIRYIICWTWFPYTVDEKTIHFKGRRTRFCTLSFPILRNQVETLLRDIYVNKKHGFTKFTFFWSAVSYRFGSEIWVLICCLIHVLAKKLFKRFPTCSDMVIEMTLEPSNEVVRFILPK
jgi:hypothetical protein